MASGLIILARTGLQFILISDSIMQPLAFYWKKRCEHIVTIINTSGFMDEMESKIKRSFSGHRDRKLNGTKLNELETVILDLMLAEKSVKQIAFSLETTEQKIYQIRHSLQKNGRKTEIAHPHLQY